MIKCPQLWHFTMIYRKKKSVWFEAKKKEKMLKFSLLSHVIVIRSMSPDESERFFCENDKKKKKMSSFYAAEHSIIKCTAMNLTAMTIFGWPLAHLHNQSFFFRGLNRRQVSLLFLFSFARTFSIMNSSSEKMKQTYGYVLMEFFQLT